MTPPFFGSPANLAPRHDDGDSGIRGAFEAGAAGEAADGASEELGEWIVLQPCHDDLAFGITKADIVFDDARAVLGVDHQADRERRDKGGRPFSCLRRSA